MSPSAKRIQQLEAALTQVSTLLQGASLTPIERQRLVTEGNNITLKLEALT